MTLMPSMENKRGLEAGRGLVLPDAVKGGCVAALQGSYCLDMAPGMGLDWQSVSPG